MKFKDQIVLSLLIGLNILVWAILISASVDIYHDYIVSRDVSLRKFYFERAR